MDPEPVSTDENALASEGDLPPQFRPEIRSDAENPPPSQEETEILHPQPGTYAGIHEVVHKHVQTPPIERLPFEPLPGPSSDLGGSVTPASTPAPTPTDTLLRTPATSGAETDRESKNGRGKNPRRHDRPTIQEASARVWCPTSQQKYEPYRKVHPRQLATYK